MKTRPKRTSKLKNKNNKKMKENGFGLFLKLKGCLHALEGATQPLSLGPPYFTLGVITMGARNRGMFT